MERHGMAPVAGVLTMLTRRLAMTRAGFQLHVIPSLLQPNFSISHRSL